MSEILKINEDRKLWYLEQVLKFRFRGINIEKLYFGEGNKIVVVIENNGVVTDKDVIAFLEEYHKSITQ